MQTLRKLRDRLNDHLQAAGETYLQHLVKATSFAARMMAGALACLIHGLLPFLLTHTGSDCVRRLYDEMVENRRQSAGAKPGGASTEVGAHPVARRKRGCGLQAANGHPQSDA